MLYSDGVAQMNHYEVLGVPPNATQAEIEAAFEKQKQVYNPDTHPDHARINIGTAKQIYRAYATLHDPGRRKEYDRLLESRPSQAVSQAISEEEFRTWLEPGQTIEQGLSAKIEAERVRRENERLYQKDPFGVLFDVIEVLRFLLVWLLILGVGAGVAVGLVWLLVTAVRWFWEHPLF